MNPLGANRGTTSPTTERRRRVDPALIVFAVVAVGVGAFLLADVTKDEVDPLPTIGPSMTPTITSGTYIDVDPHAYDSALPQLGDIVGFQGPENITTGVCGAPREQGAPCAVSGSGYESIRLVKRVVGLPGDRIAFTPDGHSIRNGQVQPEPFINPCQAQCGLPRAITVPPNHYFMVGDNRPMSTDSREFGAVPFEAIDGRVILGGTAGS